MPNPNIAALKELAEKAEASRHTIQFGNNAMNAFRQACKPTAILQIISHTAAVEAELAEVKGRLAALEPALQTIADGHVPDQPATSGLDEVEYILSWVRQLRMVARKALSTPKAEPPVAACKLCTGCGRFMQPHDGRYLDINTEEPCLEKDCPTLSRGGLKRWPTNLHG